MKTKRKNKRGPALPPLYMTSEQFEAIDEGLPKPYSASARALLLACAGRLDLVPEHLQGWVTQWLREVVKEEL